MSAKTDKYGANLSEVYEKYGDKSGIKNGKFAPRHPSRIMIAGPSGCRKTTTLVNMLMPRDEDIEMKFTQLYICAKDPEEPLYKHIRDTFEKFQELADEALYQTGQEPDTPYLYFTTDPQDVDVNELDRNERNIIVYDDCMLDLVGQHGKKMNEFYMRGRKANASMIFITQDAFAKDLKFIRSQCDYLILFNPGSAANIRLLVQELGIDGEKFMAIAKEAWNNKGFVFVDKNNLTNELGIRNGFYP